MKTLSLALLLVASMAFVMLGCSDNSGIIVPPTDQSISLSSAPAMAAKAGPVVHVARGSGNVTLEGKNCVFAITAHQFADGSFGGTLENNAANAFDWKDAKINADVKEFKVDGKVAILLGQMKTSGYEGWYLICFVIDNGQGGKTETPDQISYWVQYKETYEEAKAYYDQSTAFLLADLETLDIDRGNIQVY